MTYPRVSDEEIKVAVEKAKAVFHTGCWFHEKGRVFIKLIPTLRVQDFVHATHPKDAEHIAQMDPQFSQEVLAELLWLRGMVKRAKVAIYSPLEWIRWLSDLKRGPEVKT